MLKAKVLMNHKPGVLSTSTVFIRLSVTNSIVILGNHAVMRFLDVHLTNQTKQCTQSIIET
jgi:hypothetical protein